jgi:hypothetical protein
MTARVRIVSPQEFGSWLEEQRTLIAEGDRDVQTLRDQLSRDGDL